MLVELFIRLNINHICENRSAYLSIKRMIEESGNVLSKSQLVKKFIESNPRLALKNKETTFKVRYKSGVKIHEIEGEYIFKTTKGKVKLSDFGLEMAFGYICKIDYKNFKINILSREDIFNKLGDSTSGNITYISIRNKKRLIKDYYIVKEIFPEIFVKDTVRVKLPVINIDNIKGTGNNFKTYSISVYEHGFNYYVKVK